MELKLIVLAGAKQDVEIPLKKDKFLIGRAKECALRAGSEAISRRHCAIVRRKDRWTVRDLGSRNGTYVNDKRITEEVLLNPGDELRVGPLKFRVASRDAASPSKAKPATPAPAAKPQKQPAVKDLADVVGRTISESDDSATEEDISRWLLGVPDPNADATLKETRTIRLEETKTISRAVATGDIAIAEDGTEAAASTDNGQADEPSDEVAAAEEVEKSGGWNLFKRGKGASSKKKPGKLPPRPDQPVKDSREAAADILREMTRRR